MARVVGLYLRPSSRTLHRRVSTAHAVAGRGIEGDHAGGGNRQVTLIDKKAWEDACSDVGLELDAGARRANVVVEGIPLGDTIGQRIRVGDSVVEVIGETRPCKLMEDVAPGLQEALSPERRGGVYGRIVEGGEISVGSPVELLGVPEPSAES